MKIILDTNIYRNLIRDKSSDEIEDLKEKIITATKAKSIIITFPIIPAMELMNHFNSVIEVKKDECRKALNLLVSLSTEKTDKNIHVKFTPPMDVVLGHYFFGEENDFLEMYSQAITLAQKLVGNLETDDEENLDEVLEKIGEQLDFEKNVIRDNYENYLKTINEGNVDWTFFQTKSNKMLRRKFFDSLRKGELSFLVANSFVDRAYFHANKTYEKNEDFFKVVVRFMKDFCPVLIMNELILDSIGSGAVGISDLMDKRWNTILDISLIFGTLYNPDNSQTLLVTEDKNIIEAFNTCNYGDRIMKLEDFLKFLEIEN